MLRSKQVSTVRFFWLLLGNNLESYISRTEYEISSLLLIRRHPDLNWGKRICSPPPYHSAMPPKRYKIDENFPLLVWITELLFFYCTCILFFLILFQKESLSPFLIGFDPPLLLYWLYSISKHTMPKSFPPLFYKKKWIFSHKSHYDKFEPLTIDCWFRIHERFLNWNLKLCFLNDIRKYKLIHNSSVLIFFSIKNPSQFQL